MGEARLEMGEARLEVESARLEMESARLEMESARLEMEPARLEMEPARLEMESLRNSGSYGLSVYDLGHGSSIITSILSSSLPKVDAGLLFGSLDHPIYASAPQSTFFHSPITVSPYANTYHKDHISVHPSSAAILQHSGASTATLPFIVSSPKNPRQELLKVGHHNNQVKALHRCLQRGEQPDVSSQYFTSGSSGKSPIAKGALAGDMANRTFVHPLPVRPPLLSHQSNSVPSTPHQYAKDFRTRSRSPSPHAGLGGGSHSPRSVVSEANGTMATLPRGRPTCKYETGASYSRRRIQYDVGDAPLDPPKEEPKTALDPYEEKKLSGDMRELYDRLLPSEESENRRIKFIEKLEGILRKQWPTTDFKVKMFGSSGNNLCTNDSDVDICIQDPNKGIESMHQLAEVLASNGMERVQCIAQAKVPIVKIWDPELRLAADMNINNTVALENTRMIKTYVGIDERVRPLAMIIKHWSKRRILNDAGLGGTLSSYTWTCMVMNFLQTRDPPILPALHQLPHKEWLAKDGTDTGFNDDLEKLKGFGSANKETIGELLFYFFRFYAYEVDYGASVISVRHGKLLTRREKSWDLASGSKEGQWRLCVEEPFTTTRNLGNSADYTAWRGIHLELRQAFALLADGGQLDKACEEYHFPPEEKTIFKKPVGGPVPIMSAAPTQHSTRNVNGRGGSMRGARHSGSRTGNSNAFNGNGRRSSSGSAHGPTAYFNNALFSPPLGMAGNDYVSQHQLEAVRLHEHLTQQAQHYALQIEQLKQKMLYSASRIQAGEHYRSINQHSGHNSQDQSTTGSPQKTHYMLSRGSSPKMAGSSLAYLDFTHSSGQLFDSQGISTQSQDGTRTNPSSPSLSTSVPSRRNPQRSPVSSDSGATRSHSQPARGMQQSFMFNPAYPQFAMSNYQVPQYQGTPSRTTSGSQSHSGTEGGPDIPIGYDPLCRTSSLPVGAPTNSAPKEYLGYYVHHDPRQALMATQQQQIPVFALPQIPQYSDLAHRRNRPQDLHLSLNGFRPHMSRSPSPLGGGHHRTFSTPSKPGAPLLHSAPLDRVISRFDRSSETTFPVQKQQEQPHVPNGLLIVNGSSYPDSVSNPVDDDSSSSIALDDQTAGYSDRSDIFLQDTVSPSNGQQYIPSHLPQFSQSEFYPSSGLPYQTFHPETENPRRLYSSPPQAFPAYVDQGMSASKSTASQDDEPILSPRSVPWTSNYSHKPVVTPIDTSPPVQSAVKTEPKTAPFLSPVYENRSPSPTAQRRVDSLRPQAHTNGIHLLMNGEKIKENGTPNGRHNGHRNEPPPPTPASKSNSTNSSSGDRQGKAPIPNGNFGGSKSDWQQASASKKKKNRPRSRSGPALGPKSASSSSKANGESIPRSTFERKGG
ncbi:putative acetate kinase [Venturia nashicola]|nr:putative acetate kinase [Venturia nashicola]